MIDLKESLESWIKPCSNAVALQHIHMLKTPILLSKQLEQSTPWLERTVALSLSDINKTSYVCYFIIYEHQSTCLAEMAPPSTLTCVNEE